MYVHTQVSIFMFLNHRSFGEKPKIPWKSFGTFNLQTFKELLKHEKTRDLKGLRVDSPCVHVFKTAIDI